MKKVVLIILLFLSFFSFDAESKKKDELLNVFIDKMKSAKDISFNYRVNILEGYISISKDALYLSQKNRMEIYETSDTRYIYYKKRNKVDIDCISNNSNNIMVFMEWMNRLDKYQITSKEKEASGAIKYKLVGEKPAEEIIEVTISANGDIRQLAYQSNTMKRVSVSISDFTVNGKPTSDYFTFDPSQRTDMEVTDYRN